MELLGRVIVYPLLWIVYIMLPFVNVPLSSLHSSFLEAVSYYGFGSSPEDFCKFLCFLIICLFVMYPTAAGCFYLSGLFDDYMTSHSWPVKILLTIAITPVIVIWSIVAVVCNYLILWLIYIAIFLSLDCLFYFGRVFSYLVIKPVAHIFIVGFKNRRACQFVSALTAVVLGVTKAKVFAAIPTAYGIFLTIPDLDPDPWVSFKVRFSHFLRANMDEESLNAVLYSKYFKMVSCNEMMPTLLSRPVRSTTTVACFVLRESSSHAEDGHDFIVEPEYKIGMCSITTRTRADEIDVLIFTPFCGVKKRTMKNTPRARYNLDMSARFWKDHPEVGISKEVIRAHQDYDEAKIHCISIDKWIDFCGTENYVFMEYDWELGTPLKLE